jgi:hypothetical protein
MLHVLVYTVRPRALCRNHRHALYGLEAGDRVRRGDREGQSVHSHVELLRQPMPPPASRNAILRLLNASRHTACPCHGCSTARAATGSLQAVMNVRKYAAPVEASNKEYAFEVCSVCSLYVYVGRTETTGSRSLLRICASATGQRGRSEWILRIWTRKR